MNAKLIAAATAALLAAASPAAANTQGTLQLNGTVAQVCTISVQDGNQSLNISGGENTKQVGTVTENCNRGAGYSIAVTSANAGRLVSGNNFVAYSVTYDGQANAVGQTVARTAAQFNKVSPVAVTMPANPTAIAGTYADTLTFTISAQ